jgi:hypothetical protein
MWVQTVWKQCFSSFQHTTLELLRLWTHFLLEFFLTLTICYFWNQEKYVLKNIFIYYLAWFLIEGKDDNNEKRKRRKMMRINSVCQPLPMIQPQIQCVRHFACQLRAPDELLLLLLFLSPSDVFLIPIGGLGPYDSVAPQVSIMKARKKLFLILPPVPCSFRWSENQ